jgi:hypothetical protein
MNRLTFPVLRAVREGRFLYLFISLMIYLLLTPWVRQLAGISIISQTGMTLILVAAVFAVSDTRLMSIIASTVGAPALLVSWTSFALQDSKWEVASHIMLIVIF